MWNVRTSIDTNSKANWDIVPCDVRISSAACDPFSVVSNDIPFAN